jgi:hypothetical protein
MGSDAGVSGTEWSKRLYREHRAAMPPEVRQARDVFVARNQWDVVAAGVLDWAMANRILTADDKVKALGFAQAGMFGRSSAYYEQRLSTYRPPLGPLTHRG